MTQGTKFPDVSSCFFPIWNGSSTLTFYFYARANEGVGDLLPLTSFVANASNLAIVVTDNEFGKSVDTYLDVALRYLLNVGIDTWYSPATGTVEEAIVAAFRQITPFTAGLPGVIVLFDGQFGRVYVSR